MLVKLRVIQMSLVIMGTLKGQDNEEVAKICREKYQ